MKEVRLLGPDEFLIQHYPDQSALQYANMYPIAWLGIFRDWFKCSHLKHEFCYYLKTHILTLPKL